MAMTMGQNPFTSAGGPPSVYSFNGPPLPSVMSFGGMPVQSGVASFHLPAKQPSFAPNVMSPQTPPLAHFSAPPPRKTAWSITEALSLGDGDVCENIGEVIVRCEESLESGPVATLPPGSHITITMISGRRALIQSGRLVGWISIRSADGIPLIQRCDRNVPLSPFRSPQMRGEPSLMSEIHSVVLPERQGYVPSGFGAQQRRDGPPQRPRIAHEQLSTGIDTTIAPGDVATNYHAMPVTEDEDDGSAVLTTLSPNSTIGIEDISGARGKIRVGSMEGWVDMWGEDGTPCLMKTSGVKTAFPVGATVLEGAAGASRFTGPATSLMPPAFTGVMGGPPPLGAVFGGNGGGGIPGMKPMLPPHQVARGHYHSLCGPLPAWGPELLPPLKIGDLPPDHHHWEPFPKVGPDHQIPSSWVQYRRVLAETGNTNDAWERRALNEPTVYRDYTTYRATTRSLMLKRHEFDLPDASGGPASSEDAAEIVAHHEAEKQKQRLADEGLDQVPEKAAFGKQYGQHGKLYLKLQDPKHPSPDHFKVSSKEEVETYAGVLMAAKSQSDRDKEACTFA